MRAILVCVDYSDLLAITLPYNRHHFDEVMVVTDLTDDASRDVALANDASVYRTDAFYRDGADFNKWRALEEGLDEFGRSGWLCIMDADVLWPKVLPPGFRESLTVGKLYTPLRHMFHNVQQPIPQEADWQRYPAHQQFNEWAGYSQIFHADDPVLGEAPWHQIDWRTAGGADSFFQQKWSRENKIRPAFNVLHLGEAGLNWCGRATERVDGSKHPDSDQRIAQLRDYIARRRYAPSSDRFAAEKIKH